MLGLFDEHLNYEKIYREGLAKGNIKPSQEEIDKAAKKAEESYKIAYASLFSKDIAPFNPEHFKHEVQSPLTLEDVKAFVLKFVNREGRKVIESDDGTFEFLLPDSLSEEEGLDRRYKKVTFDRATAIRNSEAEFMAIGHPFTNAVLKYCGSVDFGGLACSKVVRHPSLPSGNGTLFNFTVKVLKETQDDESIFFKFLPIFVDGNGTVGSEETTQAIVSALAEAKMTSKKEALPLEGAEALFEKAKDQVFTQCAQYDPWDDDIFCLNALRVEVV